MTNSDAKAPLGAEEFAKRLSGAVAARDGAALEALMKENLSRDQRKELKRAAHRLRSSGTEVTVSVESAASASRPAAAVPQEKDVEALATSIDAYGGRMIWLYRDSREEGRDVAAAYVDDEVGLKALNLGHASRKKARAMVKDMLAQKEVPVIPMDAAYARALLEDAVGRTRARGRALPEGYGGLHEILEAFPPAAPLFPHPAEALAGNPEKRELVEAARQSAELLRDPPLSGWGPGEALMREIATKIQNVEGSTVIVTPGQRREQIESVFDAAAREQMNEEGRRRWQRRLLDTAWVARERGEKEIAVKLAVLARAIGDLSDEIPAFLREIIRRPFAPYLERKPPPGGSPGAPQAAAPKPEGEGKKSKLIVPR